MSTITLLNLTCFDAQEGGGDEVYFKFKDNFGAGSGKSSVFSGMDAGDSRAIFGNSFSFNGSVKVTAMEQDGLFNPDDTIQSLNLSTPGVHTVTFTGDGAQYQLKYLIA